MLCKSRKIITEYGIERDDTVKDFQEYRQQE